MNIFSNLPEYLATAIIAAIFAILGFFARKAYDRFEELRAKKNNTIIDFIGNSVMIGKCLPTKN